MPGREFAGAADDTDAKLRCRVASQVRPLVHASRDLRCDRGGATGPARSWVWGSAVPAKAVRPWTIEPRPANRTHRSCPPRACARQLRFRSPRGRRLGHSSEGAAETGHRVRRGPRRAWRVVRGRSACGGPSGGPSPARRAPRAASPAGRAPGGRWRTLGHAPTPRRPSAGSRRDRRGGAAPAPPAATPRAPAPSDRGASDGPRSDRVWRTSRDCGPLRPRARRMLTSGAPHRHSQDAPTRARHGRCDRLDPPHPRARQPAAGAFRRLHDRPTSGVAISSQRVRRVVLSWVDRRRLGRADHPGSWTFRRSRSAQASPSAAEARASLASEALGGRGSAPRSAAARRWATRLPPPWARVCRTAWHHRHRRDHPRRLRRPVVEPTVESKAPGFAGGAGRHTVRPHGRVPSPSPRVRGPGPAAGGPRRRSAAVADRSTLSHAGRDRRARGPRHVPLAPRAAPDDGRPSSPHRGAGRRPSDRSPRSAVSKAPRAASAGWRERRRSGRCRGPARWLRARRAHDRTRIRSPRGPTGRSRRRSSGSDASVHEPRAASGVGHASRRLRRRAGHSPADRRRDGAAAGAVAAASAPASPRLELSEDVGPPRGHVGRRSRVLGAPGMTVGPSAATS